MVNNIICYDDSYRMNDLYLYEDKNIIMGPFAFGLGIAEVPNLHQKMESHWLEIWHLRNSYGGVGGWVAEGPNLQPMGF